MGGQTDLSLIMNTEKKYFAVAGILVVNRQVLLVRHTYGHAKGKLLIPGGYVKENEMPEEAIIREFREETNLTVKPNDVVALKITKDNWYCVFEMEYVDGTAASDGIENSEAGFFDLSEIAKRDDVTETTKDLLKHYKKNRLKKSVHRPKRYAAGEYSLYL
ncbi:MAG: NUDIX hydrolase [Clostridia bacterium]|nr:NUDIX hydrolase [Clostridia bacterium]